MNDNTVRNKSLKWLGLIGSLLLGGVAIAKGDTVNGLGVITAAFSSAGVIKLPGSDQ